jgi:uncharacterized membrane protein
MNTTNKCHKILGAVLFATCLFTASSASAHWHGGWGGGGWGHHHGWGGYGGGVYIGPSYGYSNCGWVGGHWRHGRWIPAHRVCWY